MATYMVLLIMTFEWDENKNEDNKLKHKVSFEEAQYAFFDKNRIILEDEKHSQNENRFFCIGKIETGIVTVRFTMRNNNIRFFGAGYWRSGGKNMKNNDIYTDAPDDIKEAIETGKKVKDFLPPPELLVTKEDTKKVTIALSKRSIEFFKKVSKENHVPYQLMIRKVIDNYTDHYTH